jgi:hypothetical protein
MVLLYFLHFVLGLKRRNYEKKKIDHFCFNGYGSIIRAITNLKVGAVVPVGFDNNIVHKGVIVNTNETYTYVTSYTKNESYTFENVYFEKTILENDYITWDTTKQLWVLTFNKGAFDSVILPNGVRNEIIGENFVQNVKNIAYYGNELWQVNMTSTYTISFFLNIKTDMHVNNFGIDKGISNIFGNMQSWENFNSLDIEGLWVATTSYGFKILKTKLIGYSDTWTNEQKRDAFNLYLQDNDNFIYYQTTVPIITPIKDYIDALYGQPVNSSNWEISKINTTTVELFQRETNNIRIVDKINLVNTIDAEYSYTSQILIGNEYTDYMDSGTYKFVTSKEYQYYVGYNKGLEYTATTTQQAYNDGYSKGVEIATNDLENQKNSSYNNGYEVGKTEIYTSAYNEGYSKGLSEISLDLEKAFQEGKIQGIKESKSLTSIISRTIGACWLVVSDFLSIEILGISLWSILGLFALVGLIILVLKLWL